MKKNAIIFIPAFNEGDSLENKNRKLDSHTANITRALEIALSHVGYPIEGVLAIDDRSSDNTRECMQEYHKTCVNKEYLTIKRLDQNSGKGYAFLQAYRHAIENDIAAIFCLDADVLYINQTSIHLSLLNLSEKKPHIIVPSKEMFLKDIKDEDHIIKLSQGYSVNSCFELSGERVVLTAALQKLEKTIGARLFEQAFTRARFGLERLLNSFFWERYSNPSYKDSHYSVTKQPFRALDKNTTTSKHSMSAREKQFDEIQATKARVQNNIPNIRSIRNEYL